MRIGIWPPGWFDPERYVDCPAGLLNMVEVCKKELREAEEEVKKWCSETERCRIRAWREYYEKNVHFIQDGQLRTSICSGYFNPLHAGHVRFLQAARELADQLIVIVNNDAQQIMK